MTPFAGMVILGVTLAGFVLPAWPIWRMRRWYLSIPVSALLSCWLLVTHAVVATELTPDYDNNFGAGMAILFSPGLGVGYAAVLFALRAATRRGQWARPKCGHATAGLVVWASLLVFSVVLPFIAPPPARKGDPLFWADYFFYCGPIVLLAVTMSLVYLWGLAFSARQPPQCVADQPEVVP